MASPSGAFGRLVASRSATFHFVCFAWIFFRAPTFAHATLAIGRIAHGDWTMDHVAPKVLGVLAVAVALHLVPRRFEAAARDTFVEAAPVLRGLVLAAAAVAIHFAAAAKPEPFVYGQF